MLKAAFVQGLVTKDEFDARVGQTFVSRTYAELAAVTAGLPAGLIGDRPPRKAAGAQARPPLSHSDKARRCMVIAVALMTVAMFVPSGPAVGLFAPLCFTACVIAGAQILASRYEKRSRGQLPGGCQHLLRQRDAGKNGTKNHVRPSGLLSTLDERRGIMRTAPLAVPERVACRIAGAAGIRQRGVAADAVASQRLQWWG